MKLQGVIVALDWFAYIVFLASAVYCIIVSNVIQNYANKTTDIYKSEIDAENIQMPEFLLCDYSNRIRQLIGSFEMEYYLKEKVGFGWKKIEDIRIRNNEKCFFVNLPSHMKLSYKTEHSVQIMFNTSLSKIPELTAFISKKNSKFIKSFYDGNPMISKLSPGQKVLLNIEEEQTEYLPENCREQPMIEYLLSQFANASLTCPSKCLPKVDFGQEFEDIVAIYPICPDELSLNCVVEWLGSLVKNVKPFCKSVSYSGGKIISSIPQKLEWCSKVCQHIW